MKKLCVFVLAAAVGWAQPVLIQMGPKSLVLNFPSSVWPEWEGPLSPGGIPVHGIPLKPVFEALGGLNEDQRVFVFTTEGLQATLKKEAMERAIIGFPWGEEFSQGPTLFAQNLTVPGVRWLVVDWNGETLPEVGKWPKEAQLTLALPEGERTFTLAELEQRFVAVTYPGSYVTSSGRVVSAVYTGFLLSDLFGDWPEDAELEVVAADGYRMRYRYGSLSDSEGTWILAFKRDGKYMPFNPGYFRMVKVGPKNPRFQSAASAKMVVRIEIHGQYTPYSLRLLGVGEKIFSRWDLESAVACPCRAQAVTSTHKGATHSYIGLPLWRLLAYVDDERSPEGFGVKYDNAAFNWEKAQGGYLVEIRGKDGFSQTIPSSFLAGNDQFILALKVDGRFLSEEEGGHLFFVWDDGAEAPVNLKRVKWVTEIVIHFPK